ncbi:MAG: Uncharacterised protein [Bacteroidota bacterium]|nr:MAG: Uncharacterised protein [Bacteroidota bacterium]
MEKQKNTFRNSLRWWAYSIGGLVLIGAGLSVLGEAIIAKSMGKAWFLVGTLALILVNSGICLVAGAVILRLKK